MSLDHAALFQSLQAGESLTDEAVVALADYPLTPELLACAAALRDQGFARQMTYSRKVFIPLTQLCRDVCHYCTFAKTPRRLEQVYLSLDDVLAIAREGAAMGCKEALFTLGERPELRYRAAREALAELGFATTLEYVAHCAQRVLEETGLLPHINAGNMDRDEMRMLRRVSASMGIMLESASERLGEKGMPHYGSPDKEPARRLQTLALAGEECVPFTSGILIGIGETRRERLESLLALRRANTRGQLQEVIVQNFRAKPDTKMAQAPEPDLDELLWSIAMARVVFGAGMSIQAPPNLSPGVLPRLIDAGINDWGGVSPVTPDHVNPEAPWPHLQELALQTAHSDKVLTERLTLYPRYLQQGSHWLEETVLPAVLKLATVDGLGREDHWHSGSPGEPPQAARELLHTRAQPSRVSAATRDLVRQAERGERLSETALAEAFCTRGEDLSYLFQAADALRQSQAGSSVGYVVNRNINYTNICYFKCQFCAFSKGKLSENLRGRPYDLSDAEIARRVSEAWARGATEVCMQGGIHPDYTGQTYLDILATVKAATPDMHVHAFSPLEVWQGAATLGVELPEFLQALKAAGLGTLPGTAAEILDEEIRQILCPDKLTTQQWLTTMETAHRVGLRTTATVMYGHVERPEHWARHLLAVRDLQARTGGFTEFVPLPYVHMEAPLYLKGRSRMGPTFREAILMHTLARLSLGSLIPNIQASWVKLGVEGAQFALQAGANDLGGTLMNETITRSAGATHGQELPPLAMEAAISAIGRQPYQRTTLYQPAPAVQVLRSYQAGDLAEVENTPPRRRCGPKPELIHPALIASA